MASLSTTELHTWCQRWLDDWTGNRPHDLISWYTDDAVYIDPARSEDPNDPERNGGLRGKDQLLAYFTKLLGANPEWAWTVEELMPTEKGFTLKWKAAIPTPQGQMTFFGLDIVELRDGKISRNEVYFDRSEWLRRMSGK